MNTINASAGNLSLVASSSPESPMQQAVPIEKQPEKAIKAEPATTAEHFDEMGDVTSAIDIVSEAVRDRGLSFQQDDVSGRSIITVVDTKSNDVIRQIPAEEVLAVARTIKRLQNEMMQSVGILFDGQV